MSLAVAVIQSSRASELCKYTGVIGRGCGCVKTCGCTRSYNALISAISFITAHFQKHRSYMCEGFRRH